MSGRNEKRRESEEEKCFLGSERRGRFPGLLWSVLFLPTNFTFHSPFPPSSFVPSSSFLPFIRSRGCIAPCSVGVGKRSERASVLSKCGGQIAPSLHTEHRKASDDAAERQTKTPLIRAMANGAKQAAMARE